MCEWHWRGLTNVLRDDRYLATKVLQADLGYVNTSGRGAGGQCECTNAFSHLTYPSTVIDPDASSTIRNSASISVDLPAPVLSYFVSFAHMLKQGFKVAYRPTTPIFSPPLIRMDNPRRTRGSPGLYLMVTSLNSIAPLSGHCGTGLVAEISCGFSCGRRSSRLYSSTKNGH